MRFPIGSFVSEVQHKDRTPTFQRLPASRERATLLACLDHHKRFTQSKDEVVARYRPICGPWLLRMKL